MLPLHLGCKCNAHASSCHFSRSLWLATGRRSGGVCDDCRHNTEGRHCQSCKKGFFRDPGLPRSSPDVCRRKNSSLSAWLSVKSAWLSRDEPGKGLVFGQQRHI